jgi:hypothetical protein
LGDWLAGRARLDARVKRAVVALECALAPDFEQRLSERAVVIAIHRRLVVLAAGYQHDGGIELLDDRRQPPARRHLRERGVGVDSRLAGRLHEIELQLVVERLVLAIRAHCDCRWHQFRPLVRGRERRRPRARDRSAMATVRQHENPHARSESAQFEVKLVVDQLAVVEAPRLVLLVGLVAAHVGNLSAVA